ncbi:MAG: hypothetical protein KAW92_11645 [Candidatus Cloacimonetes bacterium]|nr:hypothetical protein [Candidatus Cloacimonadota bacterium]
MNYNDILMICDFCGKKVKFGEMDQVCLRKLTEEEVEKFKEEGKIPALLEFVMRCDQCKEKGILTTLQGYSIDTTPVKLIPWEKTIEMTVDREIGRFRAETFSKRRKK